MFGPRKRTETAQVSRKQGVPKRRMETRIVCVQQASWNGISMGSIRKDRGDIYDTCGQRIMAVETSLAQRKMQGSQSSELSSVRMLGSPVLLVSVSQLV